MELAPVATLVVALVALFVGLRTVQQRDLADRRVQWWERFRWASRLTLSPDAAEKELGLEVLELLGASRLAGPEEIDILEAGISAALARRADLLDDGWAGKEDDDTEGGSDD